VLLKPTRARSRRRLPGVQRALGTTTNGYEGLVRQAVLRGAVVGLLAFVGGSWRWRCTASEAADGLRAAGGRGLLRGQRPACPTRPRWSARSRDDRVNEILVDTPGVADM
jgi:hypothetical protein